MRDFQDGPLRVGVVGLVVRGCFCLTFFFTFCLFFVCFLSEPGFTGY